MELLSFPFQGQASEEEMPQAVCPGASRQDQGIRSQLIIKVCDDGLVYGRYHLSTYGGHEYV